MVLLDEPLANLDYKLREELREEPSRIFSQTAAILIYATTEPSEALLLGGSTITLSEGRVTQCGPTSQVYRDPVNIDAARVFSDPPLNELSVAKQEEVVKCLDGRSLSRVDLLSHLPNGAYRLAFRADAASIGSAATGALNFSGTVLVTEISGSEMPVMNADGTPKWRMAPSPYGAYRKKGMKLGYQDVGLWTLLKYAPREKVKVGWLYGQFCTSKTITLKKSLVSLHLIRESDIWHDAMTQLAPKVGGLVEFYRSPARKLWTPTGVNVPMPHSTPVKAATRRSTRPAM